MVEQGPRKCESVAIRLAGTPEGQAVLHAIKHKALVQSQCGIFSDSSNGHDATEPPAKRKKNYQDGIEQGCLAP